MGQALSRSAKRGYPKPAAAVGGTSATARSPDAAVEAGASPAAAAPTVAAPTTAAAAGIAAKPPAAAAAAASEVPGAEKEQDADLSSMLNALIGSVKQRQEVPEYVKIDPKLLRKKRSAQERLQQLQGRLTWEAARMMYDDANKQALASAGGGSVDTSILAHRYDVDQQLLEKVLKYTRVPVVTKQMDGTMDGHWPGK